MPWLIDGSNVLGPSRHNAEARRALVRTLAGFARARRTRVTCVFDGADPGNFARALGAVTVVFSGTREADEIIAERARHGRGWTVVTSDRVLIARVSRRDVAIRAPADFFREAESLEGGEESGETDWESWFSDPKNRSDF